MDATLTLIDLAGAVALLLWGVHMVQSGIQRAFGPHLRRLLGRALGSRSRRPASCRRRPPLRWCWGPISAPP